MTEIEKQRIHADCVRFERDMQQITGSIEVQWKRWPSAGDLVDLRRDSEKLKIVSAYLATRRPLGDSTLNSRVELAWCFLLREITERNYLRGFPATMQFDLWVDWFTQQYPT